MSRGDPEKTPPATPRSWEAGPLSEAELAGIVRMAGDAIVAADEDQRIAFFNQGAEALFGYASAEVLGRPFDTLIPPHERDAARELVRRPSGGEGMAHRLDERCERREMRALRRDGEERVAEASVTRVVTGGRTLLTLVLRDVTEQRRAEEALRRQHEKSQRALATRDEVLTLVAHDLRNPLHGVLLRVEALCEGGDAAARGVLDPIRTSIGHMDRMIQDLMDVVRVKADRLHLAPSIERPDAVVDEAAAVYRPIAGRDRVSLRIECEAGLPDVRIDRVRIVRVLLNLLTNAGKFGGVEPAVTLAVARAPDGVRFSVSDDGPGMTPDQVTHVFDRFWQGEESDGRGLGLGLAISRSIIEAHGARIDVETAPGRGARFSFVISVAHADDASQRL